jgi:hypothetical protein
MVVTGRAALAATACIVGAAPIGAQTVDELYQRAKDEKTVVLCGAGPTGSHGRWIKEFEQTFPGVTVSFTGGLSPVLNKQVEAQLAAGKIETDLAILQTIQDFAKWKNAGAMAAFKPAGWDVIDEAYKDEDGAFVTVSINAITYAINTELVTGADVPKSALDFLKPLFAGKPDMLMRCVAISHEHLQTTAIGGLESNGNSGSHGPDSHAFRPKEFPPGFKCQTRSTRPNANPDPRSEVTGYACQ